MNHPTRMKEGKKAVKRLRTIAKAMVNDIARKMSDIQLSCYREDIELYLRVIKQERSDKDKVYSLHEPDVECISKGKEHKKYEFGNKSAIAKTGSGLIVSALAFRGNLYDGHTLSAHREQIARLTGYEPVEALTDREDTVERNGSVIWPSAFPHPDRPGRATTRNGKLGRSSASVQESSRLSAT